jgi:hypothetical protein
MYVVYIFIYKHLMPESLKAVVFASYFAELHKRKKLDSTIRWMYKNMNAVIDAAKQE